MIQQSLNEISTLSVVKITLNGTSNEEIIRQLQQRQLDDISLIGKKILFLTASTTDEQTRHYPHWEEWLSELFQTFDNFVVYTLNDDPFDARIVELCQEHNVPCVVFILDGALKHHFDYVVQFADRTFVFWVSRDDKTALIHNSAAEDVKLILTFISLRYWLEGRESF